MENEFPFVRGELLTKINKFAYYTHTKQHLEQIDRQIDEIGAMVKMREKEKHLMTREDVRFNQRDNRQLTLLRRQKQRLKQKLVELEVSIGIDIQDSKE